MNQAAVPQILENTNEDFFSKINGMLREAADICYTRVKEIPCIICPKKPEGSMSVMVRELTVMIYVSEIEIAFLVISFYCR